MALPAATFADTNADTPPIASLGVAGTSVEVPDVGVPLPPVEVDTDEIPVVAPLTGALGLSAAIDTAPAATAPGSSGPGSSEPQTTAPGDSAPGSTEPGTQPGSAPQSGQPSTGQPATTGSTKPVSASPDVPSGPNVTTSVPTSGRSTPASAVPGATGPSSRVGAALPPAEQAAVKGVLTIRAQKVVDQAAALRAAQVLATEKSAPEAPSKGGLGLTAPLINFDSPKADTLNLASGSGPASSTGDWDLMPEVLYAAIPLLLAGAAVAANQRQNAKVAAASVGVIPRRRHASE